IRRTHIPSPHACSHISPLSCVYVPCSHDHALFRSLAPYALLAPRAYPSPMRDPQPARSSCWTHGRTPTLARDL
ncbi:hypothetical protein FIBSPDRAFT_866079, partial [Athelia psychrophila]